MLAQPSDYGSTGLISTLKAPYGFGAAEFVFGMDELHFFGVSSEAARVLLAEVALKVRSKERTKGAVPALVFLNLLLRTAA